MKMRKTTAHRERSFLIMSVIMLVAALIGKVCGNVLLEDFSLKKFASAQFRETVTINSDQPTLYSVGGSLYSFSFISKKDLALIKKVNQEHEFIT